MGKEIKIELSVDEAARRINFKFDDDEDLIHFNKVDANLKNFTKRSEDRDMAKINTGVRSGGGTIPINQYVHADDYPGEPPVIHPGIHLSFKEGDQIVWFSKQKINFVIDVGPDPELMLVQDEGLSPAVSLKHTDRVASKDPKSNPFKKGFPLLCVNGDEVKSGPLDDRPDVRNQRYYKYSVTVMDTDIVLDPHFEGHDGDI